MLAGRRRRDLVAFNAALAALAAGRRLDLAEECARPGSGDSRLGPLVSCCLLLFFFSGRFCQGRRFYLIFVFVVVVVSPPTFREGVARQLVSLVSGCHWPGARTSERWSSPSLRFLCSPKSRRAGAFGWKDLSEPGTRSIPSEPCPESYPPKKTERSSLPVPGPHRTTACRTPPNQIPALGPHFLPFLGQTPNSCPFWLFWLKNRWVSIPGLPVPGDSFSMNFLVVLGFDLLFVNLDGFS